MANASLLSEIEAFLSQTGMGPTYFGAKACGNAELVKRLRRAASDGHRTRRTSVGIETAEKVRAYIASERQRRGLTALGDVVEGGAS